MQGELDGNSAAISLNRLNNVFRQYWVQLLAGALFIAAQWPLISLWNNKYWTNMDGYYSHGALVPVLALLMLLLNKPRLRGVPIVGSWWGPAILLVCIPVYMLGLLVQIQLLSGIAFMLSVFGIVLAIFGPTVTRIVSVPILFLSTMIPFADYVLDVLTLKYQVISTTLAVKTLAVMGYAVEQAGNTIMSYDLPTPLQVGIPCSGLKLLISLVTMTWFLTYVLEGSTWKKATVMLLSLPLSIVCNTLRIVMIGLVGFQTGSEESVHAFHDWSGYISLILCMAILYGVLGLMGLRQPRCVEAGRYSNGGSLSSPGQLRYKQICMVTLLLLVLSGVAGWRANGALDLPKGHLDRGNVPKYFNGWISQDLPIDGKVRSLLAKGDHLSRTYTKLADNYESVGVFITVGTDNRSFHDPLMCLSGGGGVVEDKTIIKLPWNSPGNRTVEASKVRVDQDGNTREVIYWYMRGKDSWPDTANVHLLLKRELLGDAIHFMLHPFSSESLSERARARQITWYRFDADLQDGSNDSALREFVREFMENTSRPAALAK